MLLKKRKLNPEYPTTDPLLELPVIITSALATINIKNLFEWQYETLKLGLDYSNLVYSAPTSAGKSLVNIF